MATTDDVRAFIGNRFGGTDGNWVDHLRRLAQMEADTGQRFNWWPPGYDHHPADMRMLRTGEWFACNWPERPDPLDKSLRVNHCEACRIVLGALMLANPGGPAYHYDVDGHLVSQMTLYQSFLAVAKEYPDSPAVLTTLREYRRREGGGSEGPKEDPLP